MKLVPVLVSNGYFALKENEDILIERLAPSPIKERKIIIGVTDYRLLEEQKTVEINQFEELELLPPFDKQELEIYIIFELGMNIKELKEDTACN
ncbi:hypothetical protein LG329_19465 (plasmid) [Virgibacillus necropolis]|uniref:hypothetical protein n=1 Tax=Virgibacillus necropolis TaxID=163877 RepID=UPI0038507B8D